ncbi:hypothetical protein [uncultured Desulfovibrio sp.]|uniref:hypothetical protein n=1 Tax=uncultured Desulfovibrio sp. TaxID=167968 RepID=UPI002869312C|nr:hypothetical protein [uncultured Desulfovibrio sp.]
MSADNEICLGVVRLIPIDMMHYFIVRVALWAKPLELSAKHSFCNEYVFILPPR